MFYAHSIFINSSKVRTAKRILTSNAAILKITINSLTNVRGVTKNETAAATQINGFESTSRLCQLFAQHLTTILLHLFQVGFSQLQNEFRFSALNSAIYKNCSDIYKLIRLFLN